MRDSRCLPLPLFLLLPPVLLSAFQADCFNINLRCTPSSQPHGYPCVKASRARGRNGLAPRMVAAEEKFFKLRKDFNVAARVWGDTKMTDPSKLWIALHGWADNAASFDRIAPMLLSAGASSIVCLDCAGHGLSDHRSFYHDIDHVADVLQVAELLGWSNFSLMGHSLGGCVAQAIAAAAPERVVQVVGFESFGWYSQEGGRKQLDALKTMCSSKIGSRQWTPYESLEACAQRRAKQNMIGVMEPKDAMVLVSRGARALEDGKGYVWTADPQIMVPRLRCSEALVLEILKSIRCPHLVLIARDGLFQQAFFFGLQPFSRRWCTLVFLAYWVTRIFSVIRGAPKRINFTEKASFSARIVSMYMLLCRYRQAKGLTVATMAGGAHYAHLTKPTEVVKVVKEWMQ
uniref:AB hydrolase-1 domain-containing protein n=2 Tax=Guillardia theta TaxID=55529 RepID=A0A6U6DJ90_GUITH|mmetsp:Transcript_582/g.1461  ORF Transcript_582/g.1461 Transcript_582/m.1461 type:complete len:402 (+) Transcript_582:44-1249(+)